MNDFSTNRRCSGSGGPPSVLHVEHPQPSRHPDLCFNDGSLAVLTGTIYFLVHQGFLCRRSAPLASLIKGLEGKKQRLLEGRLVLELSEPSNNVYHFLLALYDGISTLKYDIEDFGVVSTILQLATTYEVRHLRLDILRGLSVAWPKTLLHWEMREAKSINSVGMYDPRKLFPHPILVINLAYATKAYELLPAAFYDLSRSPASETAKGYTCPLTGKNYQLQDADLFSLLRGKEHGSRFLSSFIAAELEGRETSPSCIYRLEPDPAQQRICQSAFEAITFEMLRHINGNIRPNSRSADPLFTLLDAEMMQTRDQALGGRLGAGLRACEYCRNEFAMAIEAAREELWQRLPMWFGVDPQVWV